MMRSGRRQVSADVAVIGLGAMGSAAAYHLASRGLKVVGLDRHAPPHTLGSTHGRSRIIREAIFEHPRYVPFVRRAYELWFELEKESGEQLFHRTGGLMIGQPDGVLVQGARASAEAHGVPYEMLSSVEVRRRFPAYAPPDDSVAFLEPNAGLLLPERIVELHLQFARAHGAVLLMSTPATSIKPDGEGVRVETDSATILASHAIVTAGAWIPGLLPDLALPLTLERQMLHWFQPASQPENHEASCCPLSLWEFDRDRIFATFPNLGDGVKCGIHHEGDVVDVPEAVNREISANEDRMVRDLLAAIQPLAAGTLVESRVCIYTNTPDHHFLIDRHPEHESIIIASPCSGHGFKFSSAVGELLADMVTGNGQRVTGEEGRPPLPVTRDPLPVPSLLKRPPAITQYHP